MKLRTDRQKLLIVNSVVKAINEQNIDFLSKSAYNYLYLCSGFIAHYNYYGFKEYYRMTERLFQDLLLNVEINKWDNFHPGDRDYDYYMEKAEIYKRIINKMRLNPFK